MAKIKYLLLLLPLIVNVSAEKLIFSILKTSLQNQAETILNNSGNNQCVDDWKYVVHQAREQKLWALRMLDSIAKPSSGILSGNIRDAGGYDECLDTNNDGIRGRYCVGYAHVPENQTHSLQFMATSNNLIKTTGLIWNRFNRSSYMNGLPITLSICMPSSCKYEEIQTIVNNTEYYVNAKVHYDFPDANCMGPDPKPFRIKEILAMACFATVFIVVILSTIYDVYMTHNKQRKNEMLIAFSLHTNGKKLFTVKQTEGSISSINGIRVFSLAWVIIGHQFMFLCIFPNYNTFYFFEWKDEYSNVFVMAAPLAVDIFFAIGGLLLVYLFMESKEKGVRTSWPLFYMHRLFRIVPTFYACVLLYSALLQRLGDGPFWYMIKKLYETSCEKYWWSSMLFIQNYYNPADQCVTQSWYLAVDLQIHIVSPLLLIPLAKWPRRSLLGSVAVLIFVATYTFLITYIYDVGSIPVDANDKYYEKIYMPTHIRFTAWLVGAIWGYVLFKTKGKDVHIPKMAQLVIWTIFFFVMGFIMMQYIMLSRTEYNVWTASLFNAFGKPIWAHGVCWLIFACQKGYGGYINNFLSIRPFVVLARLNYSMYLMHLVIMIIIITPRRTAQYIAPKEWYFEFWSFYTVTAAFSTLWTLCFESPAIALEKVLLGRKSRTLEAKKVEEDENGQHVNNLPAIIDMNLHTNGKIDEVTI